MTIEEQNLLLRNEVVEECRKEMQHRDGRSKEIFDKLQSFNEHQNKS
jgi:hypothetical protein